MNVKVILWDFDGTLVQRPRMWSASALECLNDRCPGHGVTQQEAGEYLRVGFPWHTPQRAHPELNDPEIWWTTVLDRYDPLLSGRGLSDGEVAEIKESIRRSILDPGRYRVFEDVEPALDALTGAGWTHVVLSNHVPELESLIEGLGLRRHFRGVMSSGATGFEKPHEQAFLITMQTFSARRYVMVGDSVEADVFGARAAGIESVLVRGADARCEACTPDLLSLVSLLK